MSLKTLKVRIRICVERDENEYHAYCPELKGLHVAGDTLQQALGNAKEAAIEYLQAVVENGDPIPLCYIQHGEPLKTNLLSSTSRFFPDTYNKQQFEAELQIA